MAATLLEAGADSLRADTQEGWLPLHIAARQRNTDIFDKLLLKAPSTVNTPPLKGFTPLCCAAMNGMEGMISFTSTEGEATGGTRQANQVSAYRSRGLWPR